MRLDQPLAALEVYRSAVDRFPGDVSLLTGMARIHEAVGNMAMSRKYYVNVLQVGPFEEPSSQPKTQFKIFQRPFIHKTY